MKAIIFDWGGVLIDDPLEGMANAMASVFNLDPKKFWEVYEPYHDQFQRGEIAENQLWEDICLNNNLSKPAVKSLWHDALAHSYVVHNDVFALAKNLKELGYKIALLSNTEPPGKLFFEERNYGFDEMIFSCAEQLQKPDPAIYQAALRQLDVQPEEAVFIDDKPENVEGAQKVGIHGILFKNFEQLVEDLRKLGVDVS